MSSSTNEDPLGRRCDLGCELWPAAAAYVKCPICQGKTRLIKGGIPLSEEEAKLAKLYADFERFYENEWAPNEDPLPDDVLERVEAWPEQYEKRKPMITKDVERPSYGVSGKPQSPSRPGGWGSGFA